MKKTIKNFEKPLKEDANEFFDRIYGIEILIVGLIIIIGLIIILMTNIR